MPKASGIWPEIELQDRLSMPESHGKAAITKGTEPRLGGEVEMGERVQGADLGKENAGEVVVREIEEVGRPGMDGL